MYRRSNKSSKSSSHHPPSALLIADGSSSDEESSTEFTFFTSGSDDDYQEGGSSSSFCSSSAGSRKGHYGGAKNHQTCTQQVRLCWLTGRLSRTIVSALMMTAMGVTSYATCKHVMEYLLLAHSVGEGNFTVKPRMVSFVVMEDDNDNAHHHHGHFPKLHLERLPLPTTLDAWKGMLKHRLQNLGHHHHHQHHAHGSSSSIGLLPPVAPMSNPETFQRIQEDSEDYEDEKPNEATDQPDKCKAQHKWQESSFPVCNVMHELGVASDRLFVTPPENDLNEKQGNRHRRHLQKMQLKHHHHGNEHHHSHEQNMRRRLGEVLQQQQQPMPPLSPPSDDLVQQYRLLAHGYWRDTWRFQTPTASKHSHHHHHHHDTMDPIQYETVALKTMRFKHDATEYTLDKQRRDAVASERITFSQQAIHMFGYCGTSAVYEFAPGGDLEELMDKLETPQQWVDYYPIEERYRLAYNVTKALGDLHNTEKGQPTAIVHGDFKADQFVAETPPDAIDWDLPPAQRKMPNYKLGDFNLARLIYWNYQHNHPCMIHTDGNGGSFRSPEEYARSRWQTEKVDIYSLGNLLYIILTGHFPFDNLNEDTTDKMKKMVKHGHRPHINLDADYRHDKNPQIHTLIKAIDACWPQDPHDRATAREVQAILETQLKW